MWVIAARGGQPLYFDDVEWGWNVSATDAAGRILAPGGSRAELKDVLEDLGAPTQSPDTTGTA